MAALTMDIRYALRGMRKSPAFSAIAILTLALGIGANTAIFTIVNAVFLHPLPVKDSARLMVVGTVDPRNPNLTVGGGAVSYPNFKDIAERAQAFSEVTALTANGVSMTANGEAEQYTAQIVAGNYFEALGVVLASIGIYGVVSYSVGQRIREIGIRMALGAHPRDVLRMVLGQTALPLAAGLGCGLVGAYAAARLIGNLLYGVSSSAPLPFLAFALLLGTIGLGASYLPARRATRVDPNIALRYE